MEGKLIKRGKESYRLFVNDAPFAQIEESPYKKLSLKNCETVANGYDLDELADEYSDGWDAFTDDRFDAYKEGFQKAREILGDKKFSEQDMIFFAESCRDIARREGTYGNGFTNDWELCSDQKVVTTKWLFDKHQSLQQTEWDVEIEMETCQVMVQHGDMEFQDFPKLDSNGCLILKRI